MLSGGDEDAGGGGNAILYEVYLFLELLSLLFSVLP